MDGNRIAKYSVPYAKKLCPKTCHACKYLTNKEASTGLCSVLKHGGSGRAPKKCRGKHETNNIIIIFLD